jgi:hypothetical protein
MGGETPGSSTTVEADRIVVEHKGAVTMEEIVAIRRDLARVTARRHLSLILLDLSRAAPWSLNMLDIFDLCVGHPAVLSPRVALAVVYPPDQLSARDVECVETMGRNHGVRLGLFVDLVAAHRWLSDRRPADT